MYGLAAQAYTPVQSYILKNKTLLKAPKIFTMGSSLRAYSTYNHSLFIFNINQLTVTPNSFFSSNKQHHNFYELLNFKDIQFDNKKIDRCFNLTYEKIEKSIRLSKSTFQMHKEKQNGLAEIKETPFIKTLKSNIEKYKENIPNKYIELATTYTLLASNPLQIEKNINLCTALVLIHSSHWIMADLVDTKRDVVTDYEKYGNVITKFYLTPILGDQISTDIDDLQWHTSFDQDIFKKCKTAKKSLEKALNIIENEVGSKSLSKFKSTFLNSVYSLKDKIFLNSNEKSLYTYTQNRKKTAGCTPYINLKYLFACDDRGINKELFLEFITRYVDRINNIEEKIDTLIGLINDMFSIVKDKEENSANFVYIMSDNFTPNDLFDNIVEAHKYADTLFDTIKLEFEMFYKEILKNEYLFLKVMAEVCLQETYGISVFSLYSDRYLRENKLMRILNDSSLSEENKKNIFIETLASFSKKQ